MLYGKSPSESWRLCDLAREFTQQTGFAQSRKGNAKLYQVWRMNKNERPLPEQGLRNIEQVLSGDYRQTAERLCGFK